MIFTVEKWSDRADRAASAIEYRHASKLWGLPGTNLAVISWPPVSKDDLFYRWHYWWQAQYLDCQIDALGRISHPGSGNDYGSTERIRRVEAEIRKTLRGMRIRNIRPLKYNRYYDDRAWLALAVQRLDIYNRLAKPALVEELIQSLLEGRDSLMGVLPWRTNEVYYNVPTNGPAAILLARAGRLTEAMELTDWVFDNLVNEEFLIMDGMRHRMQGPEAVADIHPYCQGVMIGACLEISERLRIQAGLTHGITTISEAEKAEKLMLYTTRLRNVVKAVARYMANGRGVITARTGGGDGGLFKGILVRYLAQVAVRLPPDSQANITTRKLCARMVSESAESLWSHRVEVEGHPLFSVNWDEDARLPYNSPMVASALNGSLSTDIPERDLSVQLSGWMLVEAAAYLQNNYIHDQPDIPPRHG